jgi:hypothetical protein
LDHAKKRHYGASVPKTTFQFKIKEMGVQVAIQNLLQIKIAFQIQI